MDRITTTSIPLLTLAKGKNGKKLMQITKRVGSLTYIADIIEEVKSTHVPEGKEYNSMVFTSGQYMVHFADADVSESAI